MPEKIEMVLVYGEAGRNLENAVAIYAQRFPDRICSRASFGRTINNLLLMEMFKRKRGPVEQQSLEKIMKLLYWQQWLIILMLVHEK